MRRSWVLAGATLSAAVVAGTAMFLSGGEPQASQVQRQPPPAPGDPLSQDEVRRATEVATASSRAHMASGRIELLYVEREDDKAQDDRRAEAYLYDYADDALIVRTVDLAEGKVVEESKGRGVQPPPSKREELRAAELLLAHPKLGKGVRAEYKKASGRQLRTAADLQLRGLIFRDAGACRTHRCVRLFVRLPDGRFLDTSRIVIDLSAKKVQTLEW
ncbi:hypothetical protein [Nonomuraea soli]|uniref:Tat pathway signal sequence domain protein n=1 Tax=Nonomuraea soli TaxID=1032476 RepID=A0A7W0CNF6_9ACTN|nr:hypothetical protein [Nonomuraea soli]MBA2894155.1 hypothetical protein [Nonomuraea soli]